MVGKTNEIYQPNRIIDNVPGKYFYEIIDDTIHVHTAW